MKINNIVEAAYQRIVSMISDKKLLLKPFLILSIVYIIGISAILRANFYYVDDFGRTLLGYTGWENYSRYMSVFLSYFVHADRYLTDVSPLPQLMAAAIMAATSVIVLYTITEKQRFSFLDLIAAIPIGLSPYFLECLSYKFDAPYMAFSVFASVFPLLFYRKGFVKYAIFSILGLLAMCLTYQASSGIYPMLVVVLCVKRWIRGEQIKEIVKFATVSALSYVVGLLLFRVSIMHEVVDYSSTTVEPLSTFIPNTIKNYNIYLTNFLSDFKKEWVLLVASLCFGFIYVIVRNSKKNKIVTLILAVFAMMVLFFVSFGVYPFLTKPGFAPRCMYGIGVFIAIMGIIIADTPRVYPAKLACLALSWMFFAFSFTYGNALYIQSQYTDYRISLVVNDLVANGVVDDAEAKIATRITGTIGYAQAIENMPQNYQMLNRLVPIAFSDSDYYWGGFSFDRYYGLDNIWITNSNERLSDDLPIISDNVFHTIQGDSKFIWIDLH